MGTVLPFRRRVASRAVIVKLVELGYLRPAKRCNEGVVDHAVERLKTLQRDGVICDDNLSGDVPPAGKVFSAMRRQNSGPFPFLNRATLPQQKILHDEFSIAAREWSTASAAGYFAISGF
jgi:hypothetical protein